MEHLDLIIATSIIVTLFAIFIITTLKEFNEVNRGERKVVKKKIKETTVS